MIWYKNTDDIVISSRIRLARNLNNIPFPNALDKKNQVVEIIKSSISQIPEFENFKNYDFNETKPNVKKALAEEHLISSQMLEGNDRFCFINPQRTISLMLMEEDHIRLQVIHGGYSLDEAFSEADKIDDLLQEKLDFAFDENFGFLTACPTNLGTGLRASVMLHLPGLSLSNNIGNITAQAGKLGIAVRGFYGEGSDAEGSFYQISNQITMGESEADIIKRVKNIVDQIVNLEKQARNNFFSSHDTEFSERLYRAYGILKYTRSISSSEAKKYLSDVFLGQNMGIIKEKGLLSPIECLVLTEPAKLSGSEDLSPQERDKIRAEIIRKNI